MKRVLAILGAAVALVAVLLLAVGMAARALLAPAPDEWSAAWRLGPLHGQASVPALLRLTTAPGFGRLLHGRERHTRIGKVRLAWDAESGTLSLDCQPCQVGALAPGGGALQLPHAQLSVRRTGERLQGVWSSGPLRGHWSGELSATALRLRITLPPSEISAAYEQVANAVPEVRRARIEGRFFFAVQLDLPSGRWSVRPQVEGFSVSGLGTEALLGARSRCSPSTPRLPPDSWVARAVVAAEDQRFFEHPGYDLVEITAALQHEASSGDAQRGASTLGQQLAKLLVTGDDRTPARKLRELLYAVEMERTLGKARILQLYLSHAPWGHGLCGAQAAARHYFGRPARELGPVEAAWLAAMLHAPDAQARQWSRRGEPDLVRTRSVILAMKGLSRAQRQRLAAGLAGVSWPPPPPAD